MYKLKYKTPNESIITKECDSYFESRSYEMNNSDKVSEVLSLFAVFKNGTALPISLDAGTARIDIVNSHAEIVTTERLGNVAIRESYLSDASKICISNCDEIWVKEDLRYNLKDDLYVQYKTSSGESVDALMPPINETTIPVGNVNFAVYTSNDNLNVLSGFKHDIKYFYDGLLLKYHDYKFALIASDDKDKFVIVTSSIPFLKELITGPYKSTINELIVIEDGKLSFLRNYNFTSLAE